MAFYKEKLELAYQALNEQNIDMWIIAGQESGTISEPILPVISDHEFIGETALIFMKDKSAYAICSPIDKNGYINTGIFKKVIDYPVSFSETIGELIELVQPKQIALDFSENDPSSDGLSCGTYDHLKEGFTIAGFKGKIVSAKPIVNIVRGCKSDWELKKITNACEKAEEIFQAAAHVIKAGVNAQAVFAFFQKQVDDANMGYAWSKSCNPGVFSGPDCPVGHMGAPDVVIKKGHLVNIDFGVKVDEYSCDLQRMYYVLKDGESDAPQDIKDAFYAVRDGILKTAAMMKPGVTGIEVDTFARNYITSLGYDEWGFATGHQMGREAHDGGSVLGPAKPRYNRDDLIRVPLMQGNVFTIEPGITCSGGHVGLEEDVVVTKDGAKFLTPPQQELILIKE
ncbi:MAG: Xaa-Pro peptidase family protein [Erysipelotrichaceae bacterium]